MLEQNQSLLPEWGPGKTAKGRARLPSSRRRERPQLSCNLCRQRKIRCDRKHPCNTCESRGLGSSCSYAPNQLGLHEDGMRRPAGSMHDRIQQLESLVVDLMQHASTGQAAQEPELNSKPQTPDVTANCSPAPALQQHVSGTSSPKSDYGSMQMTDSGASYVSNSHWMAVLDGIAEIKEYFEAEDEMQDEVQPQEATRPNWTGPELLYGCAQPATKEEIIASIPERPVVDRLVSQYFNTFELSPAVLHSVQFQREYEEFWKNPSDTPVIWIGLLFTIMCLAAHFQSFKLDIGVKTPATISMEQDFRKMVETFRKNIVQCLVLGNYLNGGPYVLETLMLYLATEVYPRRDSEIGIWMLLGTIVQLAIHMGYHRDSSHFKGISPFANEMRKRVWATVAEMDLGISAQAGLPRLIKQGQSDTKEPLNLLDSDFDKGTIEMPPSRPETDLTPILYRLVRARILEITGLIWDVAGETRAVTYGEIMSLDAKLQQSHKSIPDCLKWRSLGHCITDTPQLIIQKVYLDIMFHRTRIVLHRKYHHRAVMQPQYAVSEKVCMESAMKLLEYQNMLQEETQPFCQLYQDRWRISCLLKHDFLLASSILCFQLQRIRKEGGECSKTPTAEVIEEALRKAHDIWAYSSDSSKEARKAAKALSLILGNHSTPSSNASTNPAVEFPSPFDFANTTGGHQGKSANLGLRFPIFDSPLPASWQAPSDVAPGPSSGISPTPGFDWGTMEVTDTLNYAEWPWNLE